MNYIEISKLYQLKNDYDIFSQENFTFTKEMLELGHYPPLLINKKYLLWGFSILRAAEEWGISRLITQEIEIDDPRALMEQVLIRENRSGRYSWKEAHCIFSLAEEPLDNDFHIRVFGKNNPAFMENLEFFRNAHGLVADLLDKKTIDFKMARQLEEFSKDLTSVILENPVFLGFSFSQKRIFIQYFDEASQREQLTPQEALQKAQEILNDQDAIAYLYRWRFPQLSDLESRFNNILVKHFKKSGISLKAPPYFEGKNFTVEFQFSSTGNLKKRIRALKDFEDHADELFELL